MKPTTGPAAWEKELRARREDSVVTAIRNFSLSRQSLTRGRLSESEILIRFFEGVTLSLQPPVDEKAADEAQKAFLAVVRYYTVPESRDDPADEERQILFIQAHCNLAVSAHRQFQRWSEKAKAVSDKAKDDTGDKEDTGDKAKGNVATESSMPFDNACKIKADDAFRRAKNHYVDTLKEASPFDVKPLDFDRASKNDDKNKSRRRRQLAAVLCATVGLSNLLLSSDDEEYSAMLFTEGADGKRPVTLDSLLKDASKIVEYARQWETGVSSSGASGSNRSSASEQRVSEAAANVAEPAAKALKKPLSWFKGLWNERGAGPPNRVATAPVGGSRPNQERLISSTIVKELQAIQEKLNSRKNPPDDAPGDSASSVPPEGQDLPVSKNTAPISVSAKESARKVQGHEIRSGN